MASIDDLSVLALASALTTIGLGLLAFAALSGLRQRRDLLLAGLFSLFYAVRMALNNPLGSGAADPAVLPYLRSALEYLVPLVGSALFADYFGQAHRRLNRLVFGATALLALVAIPYELIQRRPFAGKPVLDGLVIVFLLVFVWNLVQHRSGEGGVRLLRIGSAVLCGFVMNEHLHLIHLPWRLSSEPVGFAIFIGLLVIELMRRAIGDQGRLAVVQSELGMARLIQQSTIPEHPPRISGLEIEARYLPASEVGGDFYDFIVPGPDRLALFLADVSGHGVPAALVASMLKIALAAQSHLDDPEGVLTQLNELFCGRLKRQFFTAAFALVDLRQSTITIASGGHPPLLWLGATATEVIEADARGFVVGRMRGATFTPATLPFGAGDLAVLFTDGISEARNAAGEVWGDERLHRCIEQHRELSAAAMSQAILDEVGRWRGAIPADDDMTLIVVRRAP